MSGFQTQFIAALGQPDQSSGTNAREWGLWKIDPGPRGVRLSDFPQLEKNDCQAPSGWTHDKADWWLEEHGLIMEKPDFPLPEGTYTVTGGREVTTTLTVGPQGEWRLGKGTLGDVTHLPCRAARYFDGDQGASAGDAPADAFPVVPGGVMPRVLGFTKQDYRVVFVVGRED